MEDFKSRQRAFLHHLRQPDLQAGPAQIEERRLKIYRDLIYNNIEGFISGGFPVLRSILSDDHWHSMIRDFIARHQNKTPYFLEISQEFLHYLMHERGQVAGDPVFIVELAHYEWVELALDVAVETIPERKDNNTSVLEAKPRMSPLAQCLSYRFPVHRIGPDFQPSEPPAEPSFLVVYRNRADEVKFLEANAVTARLLQLLQEACVTGQEALVVVAQELQHPNISQLLAAGESLLEQLLALDILIGLE